MPKQRKKPIIFLSGFFLFGATLIFSFMQPGEINSFSNRTLNFGTVGLVVNQQWNIVDKIEEAKSILLGSSDLKFEEDTRGNLIKKEIGLAILDKDTGDIIERRYWLTEEEIKKANRIRKSYDSNPLNLPSFAPSDGENDFLVLVYWWNNHNSDLGITESVLGSVTINTPDPQRYIVIGNKFLMPNDDLAFVEDRTGVDYSDIVYVPYSDEIHDQDIVKAGMDYINDKVNQAFSELRSGGVGSVSFPGKLVVDTMKPSFIKNILITEQTDPKLIILSNDGGLKLAERVLIRYGLNKDATFRFTVSKTGASGPAQIMPRTYSDPRRGSGVVQRYPKAQLSADIDRGRVDVVNAIKASILVFDDHFATVVRSAKNNGSRAQAILNAKSDDEIDEIRAAIYNGGPGKYIASTGTISGRVRETKEFVIKFNMIRDLDLF